MSQYTGCTFEWHRLKVADRMVNVYRFEPDMPIRVSVGGFPERNPEAVLGHAPDLETVARLIDVLRRMNGGG